MKSEQVAPPAAPALKKEGRRRWSVLTCLCCLASGAAHAQSLTETVQSALNLYPAVLSAKAKTDAARADVDRALSAHHPQIGYGYTRNAYASGVLPSSLEANAQSPTARLNLWSGGRIDADAERSRALTLSNQWQEAFTRDDVALQAVEAYIAWARGIELVELASKNLESHSATLEDIRKIMRADVGRRIDFEQAQVRLDNAVLAKLARQNELTQARQRLSRFWPGVLADKPLGLKEAMQGEGPMGDMPRSLDEVEAAVGDELPAVAQQVAQVRAAQEAIRMARAQYWPTVDVSVARQLNMATWPYKHDTLTQVQLNMPLYTGGAVSAQVSAAVSQLTAAQYALDEARLLAKEKASLAYHEWGTAQARATQGQAQARVGDKVVEGYRLQFRLARRQLLDLLNIQAESFGYQSAAVGAFYDEQIARARLLAAMGALANRFAP